MNAVRRIGLGVAILVTTIPALAAEPARDAFGDPLPDGALARLGSTRLRSPFITALAISPDGRYIAAGNHLGRVRIWLTHTGDSHFSFQHKGFVPQIEFSRDSSRMVAVFEDKTTLFVDLASATRVPMRAFTDRSILAFSPSFSRAVVETDDGPAMLNVADGKTVWSRQLPVCTRARFSPDGRLLAARMDSDRVVIIDAVDGRLAASVPIRGKFQWCADNRSLIGVGSETEVESEEPAVWSIEDGKRIKQLGVKGELAAASPDARTLVTEIIGELVDGRNVGRTSVTRFDDVRKTHAIENNLGHQAVSDDGRLVVATRRGGIHVWDADTGKDLTPARGPVAASGVIRFSADGKTLKFVGDEDVHVWDVATGRRIRVSNRSADAEWAKVDLYSNKTHSADGRILVICNLPQRRGPPPALYVCDDERRILIKQPIDYEICAIDEESTFKIGGTFVVAVAPDGSVVATASMTAKLWKVTSGKLRGTMKGHEHYVGAMAFSPDGSLLATGSYDRTVKVWSVADGKLLRTFVGHEGAVVSLAFSPDGKRLATGSSDTTVLIWDLGKLAEGGR